MTGPRWEQLKQAFQGALERPPHERTAWLEEVCAGDAELLRQARLLFEAHETPDTFLLEPAAVDPADLAAWSPGDVVGAYRILEELGRGGMGVVYLAEDTRLQRKVALKALATPVPADAELRERLAREARAAATISHPSVATVYALEEIDGHLVIVSEYVRGETLRDAIARGALDQGRARKLAMQIAGALVAAHEAGVVHRDLKPENVLLTAGGEAKVVDFGIAHVETPGDTRLTRTGIVLGTPAYMAPEQFLGGRVDARADIYAFGVLLSEVVTGRHPLNTTGGQTSPTGAFATVRARCMQADPGARYTSARELLAVLEHIDAAQTSGDERVHARWWWGFHQGASAVIYGLMTIPAWYARGRLGGTVGRVFFILLLASAVVASILRLHWWFTAQSYPAHLQWTQARTSAWLRASEWTFAGLLSLAGVALFDSSPALAILLLAVGIGAAVAFIVVEPGTTRAAHGPDTQH
jgi:predicted Ser/Thr protein kinase